MRRMLKVLVASGFLGAALMTGGCGDASEQTPPTTGQVAIGTVTGATVKVSNASSTTDSVSLAAYTGTTDSKGVFVYPAAYSTSLSTGSRIGIAYTSTGGTFTNISGATGKAAPDLATPAGNRNLTPLSTLYNAAAAADKTALSTLLGTLDIDTVVIGAIPGDLLLLAKLNHTIGEALYQFKIGAATITAANTTVYLAATATVLGKLTQDQLIDTTNLVSALTVSLPTSVTATQKTALTKRLTMIASKTVTGAVVQ